MQVKSVNKSIQLLAGSFSPSEVNNIVIKSIDSQINNYKLKNLSNWIHDCNCDQKQYQQDINQLMQRKEDLLGVIKSARKMGSNIRLSENLEITLED
jgi:hypothetical protein